MNSETALKVGLCALLLTAGTLSTKWTVIESGTSSGIKDKLTATVVNDKDWQALWTKHTSYITPAPTLPAINFKKETVLAVFAGSKSSGGYSILISSISQKGKELDVTVVEKTPPAGAMTTQMITQPYQFVKVVGAKKHANFSGI